MHLCLWSLKLACETQPAVGDRRCINGEWGALVVVWRLPGQQSEHNLPVAHAPAYTLHLGLCDALSVVVLQVGLPRHSLW